MTERHLVMWTTSAADAPQGRSTPLNGLPPALDGRRPALTALRDAHLGVGN